MRGLVRLARRAWVARRPRVLVLCYHRVGRPGQDPFLLAVDPARFAQQVDALRCRYTPIAARELGLMLAGRAAWPLRGVVLTFDDGYADNLHAARPLLERAAVPATVFVTTGELGQPAFWWEELVRAVLGPEEADEGWDVLQPPRTPAQRRLLRLHARLRPLPLAARAAALAELGAAGAPEDRRPLRSDEVAQLDGGPVEVGSHTVTHPVLSACDAAVQAQELSDSRARLEALLGRPVTSVAYPYGTRRDVGRGAVLAAGRAGYALGFANDPGLVRPGDDPLRLRRHVARDWDGDGLLARAARWFGDA